MNRIAIILLLFIKLGLFAQPYLKPNIGIGAMPSDGDSVCYIPWYLGDFYKSGLRAGDTAYDFTLYDLNGKSLNLKNALSKGRPVLLVAGSYTCPVYRDKLSVINDLIISYAEKVDVYIVYTIDAHPAIDTSIYFGYVHTGKPNTQLGILYRQPSTYGERKKVVSDMLNTLNIFAPVFIDGPCNNWWSTYGPAPNNAYLIDTNGIIVAKHGWFDRYPDNIYCDIDSLIGTSNSNCKTIGGTGKYTFQLKSANTVYEAPGNTISVDCELKNTGSDDILIYARKIENDMPQGWQSSMCMDVCYSITTDSVVFLLAAGSTKEVHIYFYTSSLGPDSGHVKMGFKNMGDASNKNSFDVYGITRSLLGVNDPIASNIDFSISPNPSYGEIKLYIITQSDFNVQIFSSFGELIGQTKNQTIIDVSKLNSGVYFIKIGNSFRKFVKLNEH